MRLDALLVALVAALAGCAGEEAAPAAAAGESALEDAAREELAELAAPKPTRYDFPGQTALPPVTRWINGTLSTVEAAQGYESPGDRGGTSYNTLVRAEDVSDLVPPGQPVLLEIRLWYDNGPGRGADLDVFLDLPTLSTHESRAYFDEWSWTLPTKSALVSTMGEEGAPARLGVQVANGKILPGQELRYTMRVTARTFEDVLPPRVPFEVDVPQGGTGLVFSSAKHAGDVHVDAGITIVGPDDRLVARVRYDDLAVPTETIHVPVDSPGRHVVYLTHVNGGFLSVGADAPIDEPQARRLPRVVSRETLFEEPVAPGSVEHAAYGTVVTPFVPGAERAFDASGGFPLEMRPVLEADGPQAAGDVECRIESATGLVALYRRTARWDDERGRAGFSDETDPLNDAFHPENLTGGPYALKVAVNGWTGRIAVETLTYARQPFVK